MAVSLTKKLTSEDIHNTISAFKIGRITETELVQMLQVSSSLYAQISKYNAEELGKQTPTIGLMDDFHVWNALIPTGDEWQEATQTPPVRIKLNYKNHTLAAIMLKLKDALAVEVLEKIKIIEDTSQKWAIHTPEEFYYTVHQGVKIVCLERGTVFKAADTGNPDWDLFCSA